MRRGLEAVLVARETEDCLAAGASNFEQQLSDSADQHVQLGALVRTQELGPEGEQWGMRERDITTTVWVTNNKWPLQSK